MARPSIKTFAIALLLSPFATLAALVLFAWAQNSGHAEKMLEVQLISAAKDRVPEILLRDLLRLKDGTVCVTTYEDEMGGFKTHEAWARDAFTADRSLFAPEDYTILQIAVRTPDGAVRVWELPRTVPVAGARYSAWNKAAPEVVPPIRPSCLPLHRAVLRQLGPPYAYTMLDSAARPAYGLPTPNYPDEVATAAALKALTKTSSPFAWTSVRQALDVVEEQNTSAGDVEEVSGRLRGDVPMTVTWTYEVERPAHFPHQRVAQVKLVPAAGSCVRYEAFSDALSSLDVSPKARTPEEAAAADATSHFEVFGAATPNEFRYFVEFYKRSNCLKTLNLRISSPVSKGE